MSEDLQILPPDYTPGESEAYMNPVMKAWFRKTLLDWKQELLDAAETTLAELKDGKMQAAEVVDRAALEMDKALELRTTDRQRKLMAKIDAAIRRIDDDEYGYCEVTGEQIGVRRLQARPVATLCIEAQEAHEKKERLFRED